MMQPPIDAVANVTVEATGAQQRKKARVFLRVKRRRSPLTPTQKFAISSKPDYVSDDVAAGSNHRDRRDKRKSKSIAPDCIKLALPAFDPAEVDKKRSKRCRMSSSIFDNKEGSEVLERLSSVNLDHCKDDQTKDTNDALLFTPTRAHRSGTLDSSNGGDDEQRTPPSYSFDTTKDCQYNNDEESFATELQSQAPVKPKRTVIFRKITDIRKCLDKQQEHQQPGESPSQSTMQARQAENKTGDYTSNGDERAKWLRIVDVRLESDAEDVSSCSDNSWDYSGGTGPRVRRLRTRPADIEDDGENNHTRRTKKRRKLGVAVEQSQTVDVDSFLGNMNAAKFDANDDALDPAVLRLIDYSLASLHNQNGGSVFPHLSFLRIDPRLEFVADTPRGKQMVNRQFLGNGNGIADGRGRTVLHMAALWGDIAGVRAAIDMGADPSILDGQGLSPAGLAKLNGQEDVYSALTVENKGEESINNTNGQEDDEADYYYELYCLEEGNEADKENAKEEEKKDDDRDGNIQSPNGTDSPPGLARATNWDEDEDDYRFELSQGFGGWTRNGELILEACGKTQEKDDEFIQRLYHNQGVDDGESMLDDEHDSNDERYDGNDYPDEDDHSFGLGSNYDDYQDADADYYRGDNSDEESDGGYDGWKLDFRKRIVQRSAVNLNYDSDEEDDYAGPMYGYGERQEAMDGGFAYDPEIDGSGSE